MRAASLAFAHVGVDMPPLRFICKNAIPFGGGLGSSSAAIIGGMTAAFALMGRELHVRDQEELLQCAAQLENHVDNISACLYGGLQVCLLLELATLFYCSFFFIRVDTQIGVHTGERWRTRSEWIFTRCSLTVSSTSPPPSLPLFSSPPLCPLFAILPLLLFFDLALSTCLTCSGLPCARLAVCCLYPG